MVEKSMVGEPVDHRPAKAKVAYSALELVGRRLGRAHREVREAAETIGAGPYGFGQSVVGRRGESYAILPVKQVRAGHARGDDLIGDPVFVHVAQPVFAHVCQ